MVALAEEKAKTMPVSMFKNKEMQYRQHKINKLGKIALNNFFGGKLIDVSDYDFLYHGLRFFVKTNEIRTPPESDHDIITAEYSLDKQCDVYALVFVLSDFSKAFFYGVVKKNALVARDYYLKKRNKYQEGDIQEYIRTVDCELRLPEQIVVHARGNKFNIIDYK
jgi:hypothetical protein